MKKTKRWLALLLAVTLVGSNALYQLGTQMSASETETTAETDQQDSSAAAAETQNQASQSLNQQEDTGGVKVQEVTPQQAEQKSSQNANSQVQQTQQTQNNTSVANQESQKVQNTQQIPEEKTYNVTIKKSDIDGGTIKAWGSDGNKADVTYDSEGRYVKEVKENDTFNFKITAKDHYKVAKVADQNNTELKAKNVNNNVYTYEVKNITAERIYSITYEKEETKEAASTSNGDQQKSDDEKSDDADDDGESEPAAKAQAQSAAEEVMTDFYVGADRTSVTVGDKVNVKAIIKPDDYSNKNVTWKSSDEKTATVDKNGVVTTLKTGVVTITGTSEANQEYTDSVVIQINPVSVTSIKISGYNKEYLVKSGTVRLTAAVEPQNAEDKDLTWSSSDEKVATVDQNGKVTAKGQGTAVIRVENTASGKYATQEVTVYETTPQRVTVLVWVTNLDQNKTYTFYLPKDGTPVNASSVHKSVEGYVTTGDIRVGNWKSNDQKDPWKKIKDTETAKRFRYKNDQVQYSTSSSGNWENVSGNKIIDFCESLRKGDSSSGTDVKVIVGDWPYRDGENPDHNKQTIRIEVVAKDSAGNETVVYNSGTMRYDNRSTGKYGKIKFNCDESRYEVEQVLIYTNDKGTGSASKAYKLNELPSDGIDVDFTDGGKNNYLVKAIVTPKTFNVAYNANGGKNAPKSEKLTAVNGQKVTVATTPQPTRTDYIFAGWEYNGTTYYGGESFEMPPSNITFTAKWIPASTAISYKSNNTDWGTVSRSHEIVKDGATAKGSVANAKEGYEFVEWQDADGKQVSTDNFYQPDEKAGSYTAIFKAKTYNVTYQFTGTVPEGAQLPAAGKYEFDSKVTAAEVADVPGYTFEGWTSQDVTLKKGTFTMPAKNVTLTGTWKQKKGRFGYYLSLANAVWKGGTPDNLEVSGTSEQGLPKYAEKVHYSYGDKYNVISNVPTAEGHAFIGWLDKERGSQSAAIRTAGDELTYIYEKSNENQGYTLDALWASIAAKGGTYTYNGSSRQITADIAINEGLDLNEEYVKQAKKFIKTGNMEYSTDNRNWSEENPSFTDAGTYTVYVRQNVTVGRTTTTLQASAQIVINPRNVELTSATASKMYDGKALTKKEVTVSGDGFITGEGATYNVTGSQKVVGSSENTFTYTLTKATKAKNYNITTKNGTLTVTNRDAKYEITVEANSTTATYDGTEHSAIGLKTTTFTVNGEQYTVSGLTTEDPRQTNAGNYTNNITGTAVVKDADGNDVTDQFAVKTSDGSLVIDKADVTLKSANLNKVYDGTALVNGNTALVTENGWAERDKAAVAYEFTGSQTEVGNSANKFTVKWNNTVKESNYNVSIESGTLTVTAQSIIPGPDPENPDPNYKGITINDPSDVPYDGTEHKWTPVVTDAEGNALTEGTDYEVSYNKTDYTNVTGAIEVTITGKGNYTGNVTKSYQITPVSVSIKTNSAEKVYDGKPLTAAGEITGLVNNETVDFKVTGSQTKVGDSKNSYTLKWTGTAKKSNYKITSEEIGTLVVKENAKEIVVTTTGGTFTYNGLAHGATVSVSELPEGYTLEKAESSATATDVTDAKGVAATADKLVIRNAAGEDVTAKMNIKKVDGTIIVTPATLTVTTPDAEKVYDGTALTAAGTITGLVNNETATFVTTGSQTKVGDSKNTYTLTWDGTAKEENYTVSDTIGTLKVTEQSIVPGPDPENPDPNYKGIQIDAPEDHIYDGAEHKWTPTVTDAEGNALTEGTDYEVSYNKTDYTNVTGAIEVTITGKGNYTGNVTKSYQITPVSVSIKTNSAEKVYDGKPLTAAGEITGLVNNETVDFKVTGSQTKVGDSKNSYTLKWTGTAKKSNYKITSEEIGTLVVKENAKEIVVTTTGGTFTYNGLAHGATVSVSELPEGYTLEKAESSAAATDVTDAKGVAATADKLVIRNAAGEDVTAKMNIKKVDGTIIVTPVTLTVTTPDAEKVYDGTALTAAGTITGLVNNETATFVTTGSQTKVGDSKNTYTLTWNGTAKEENYTVSDTIGTLKVTEQSIVPGPDPENPDPNYKGITIDDPSDVPYDGTEHKWTPVVTDKDGNTLTEGTDYEVSYNKDDFTNVTGDITVTITGKGNYTGTVDKKYQITPKTVTITTDSDTREFNNEPLTAPGRVDGIVAGETYGFTVTGTQTYVGSSANSYQMTWAKKGENKYTAKKSNYKVEENIGTLTVTDGTPENPVDPSLVVNKTHDTKKTYKAGDVITFTITVKNIYDEAKTITLEEQAGVTLDKTTFENVQPGKEITATAAYTVTEADIIRGTFTNNVKATFSGVDKEYTGTDTVDKFEESRPHMTITKTTKDAEAGHIYKLGETINYVITVKNDGNLTLTNVKVEDALTGNAGDNAWTIDTFAPGETKTFEAGYTVTEADVATGKVVNNVTGKAENPDPNKPETPVTPGEKEDPTETPDPGLTVVKTSDKTGEVKLGDKITYTITLTNTGNVTISGVKLNDSLTGENWTLGNIKPGETVTKKTTYTVTEKDIIAGKVENHATAAGKDPDGKDITGEGEKTVTTEESNPKITVTKETTSTPKNGKTYALGEKITYKITAKNTGNLTLTDVTVSDKLTGNTGDKAFKIDGGFKPGDEATFEASYTVKESDLGKTIVNVATATGTTPDPDKPEPGVTPGETEDPTDPKNPAMSITKKVIDKKAEYKIGDTIKYEITVKNTGNTTQDNVLVEDQMNAAGSAVITKVEGAKGTIEGANVTLDTLAPGKEATITAEYTVVKEDRGNTITNAAVAKGEGENPETPEVPVDVEDVYDIHVRHVFADGEESDTALPEDYDIENLKPGTMKLLNAEAVNGYTAYPATQRVTIENEDITVTFVYYKDTIGTDPVNPDQPDNIPDKYQAVVRFEAVNGTVNIDHAVVTLFDENNEPAENGVGHLSLLQIANATANAGYDQSSLSWTPGTPTIRYEITGAMTFTARFTATPATPGTTPNGPNTPVNPANPTPANPTPANQTPAAPARTQQGTPARSTNIITRTANAIADGAQRIASDVRELLNNDDEDVPLANQKLDDHKCCILHFLIMLLTAILYGFYTHNMKKRQKKMFEAREELDLELARRGLPTTKEQEEM